MKKEDVRIGMKVVPFKKSMYNTLIDSVCWNTARSESQPFLYVVGYVALEDCFSLDESQNGRGDYFLAEDFNPYEEFPEIEINKSGDDVEGRNRSQEWVRGNYIGKYNVGEFCHTIKSTEGRIVDCSEVRKPQPKVLGDNGCGTVFTDKDIGKQAYFLKTGDELMYIIIDSEMTSSVFCAEERYSPGFKTKKELFQWLADNES